LIYLNINPIWQKCSVQ